MLVLGPGRELLFTANNQGCLLGLNGYQVQRAGIYRNLGL